MKMRGGKNKASLRISSEITYVKEVTDALGIDPDSFVEKGSRAVLNDPKSYVHLANMWRLESDIDESESLDAHLIRLIEFVESRISVFENLSETCEFDIFCGYFPNGYTGHISLSPELLKRLTTIPIKIIIKMYQPNSGDE